MKLKDFEIAYIFSYLIIKDKNGNELATINNDFEYGNKIKDYHSMTNDMRTELEKWNDYKECKVLKITNADIDNNWENNYVDIFLDILKGEE